jgi:sporulation protein YlmC with PRC-barrel domain
MKRNEVHLEQLIGTRVIDADGARIGPIEEVFAEEQDDEWVIIEYVVGRVALLDRLSARILGQKVLRFFGAKTFGGYRVPWEQMDLSDPLRPCLRCAKHELKRFGV